MSRRHTCVARRRAKIAAVKARGCSYCDQPAVVLHHARGVLLFQPSRAVVGSCEWKDGIRRSVSEDLFDAELAKREPACVACHLEQRRSQSSPGVSAGIRALSRVAR